MNLTERADINAKAARGEDVSDLVPRGPLPLTLRSRLVEKGTYSWHVPVAMRCLEEFTNLPRVERIGKEITAFLTVKSNSVEPATVTEVRDR